VADDLKDIVLNYPTTHSVSDTRRIVAAFKEAFPEDYLMWERVELDPKSYPKDVLKDTSLQVLLFLRDRCTVKTDMGALSTFGQMRNVIGGRNQLGVHE